MAGDKCRYPFGGQDGCLLAPALTRLSDALRAAEEGKDTTRRLIAHYERCLYDELGCSREDDPLECVRARMQDIRDGDAAIEAAEARAKAAEREARRKTLEEAARNCERWAAASHWSSARAALDLAADRLRYLASIPKSGGSDA